MLITREKKYIFANSKIFCIFTTYDGRSLEARRVQPQIPYIEDSNPHTIFKVTLCSPILFFVLF